ncbi:MAG TPA: hypothetical protein VHD90_27465 [Phototrophicaceae bacterium]|nr:hypothetical protein [Phototrophicaceae bacterium]
MKKTLSLLILIFSISLVAVFPTSAQAGPDPTLVTFIQTAFQNTLAVSSLAVTADGISANMAAGQTTGTPTLERMSSYQLSMSGGAWNMTGTQSFGPPASAATPEANATPEAATEQALTGANVTTLQEVILDGKTYIRYTAIPQRMETQNPPPNWTDTSTLPSGTTFAGGIPTADQVLQLLALPISTTSITNLSEGTATTMDGTSMRVFNVTMDVQSVLNSSAESVLNIGLGGAPRRPAGTATQAAVAPAATPQARAQGMTPANTQLTLTVWIGSDNLVHQITSVVTRLNMGSNADMTTTLTTTTDFTDFNQPVTISAPTLSS